MTTPKQEAIDRGKRQIRLMAKAIYDIECKRLGKKADCWDGHEEECINYWEEVIRLGVKAWAKKHECI
jgi:hypothetical protein